MKRQFSQNISPFVRDEISQAVKARAAGEEDKEFTHLENAHVLGQESTYFHVYVHCLMLFWAWRNKNAAECAGQCFRIIGAATMTAFGLVPTGNTGGSNVSPFKVMPISSEIAEKIYIAKSGG